MKKTPLFTPPPLIFKRLEIYWLQFYRSLTAPVQRRRGGKDLRGPDCFALPHGGTALFRHIAAATRRGDNVLTISEILTQPSGKCPKAKQGSH